MDLFRKLCNHPSMKLVGIILFTFLFGCRQNAPAVEKNCAYPASGFIPHQESYYPQAIARGDVPEAIDRGNRIWVIRRTGTDVLSPETYLTWNASPIDLTTLDQYLAATTKMTPVPEAVLNFTAGVSCRDLENVRKLMERHLNCLKSRKCIQGD